ncbi:efflux RND transporter periplasmic adaptor subunit [Salisaeta longa]|uniref:efflux RND transporter periplasmic adaptor subunit n=1 Tax=Salisaeta longa TaxID=503170 RepID=UPI0003B381E7|nr:efflux RND transporter periplasmic adaptor subunit [Salisaeta longa]
MLRSSWSVLLLSTLTLALVLAGCGSDAPSQGGPPNGDDTIPSVEATIAQYGALPLQERLSGTVRAKNQVAIYPEINARIVAVMVQNGDYVNTGDPLVRLNDDVYRQQLLQAEAQLQIARAQAAEAKATLEERRLQLQRTEKLAQQNFESAQQLQSIKAQVAAAKARYEQAQGQVMQAEATVAERRADLQRTVVRAPTNGHIGMRNAEVGQRVDSSTRLLTMGSFDEVEVQVDVTDELLGKINVGQTARVHVPSRDTTLQARVSRMSPFINPNTYRAAAEIDVPNADGLLKPGMFVEVDVEYGESQQATLVPVNALYEDPQTGTQGVFVAPSLGQEVPVEMPGNYNPNNPPPLTSPTPTVFRPIEVIAEGRHTAGIRGVDPGTWVITVGQNLLSRPEQNRVDARVRPQPWNRIVALQRLQDQDLLRRFMKKQQRLARQRGSYDAGNTSTPAAATAAPDSLQSSRVQSVALTSTP